MTDLSLDEKKSIAERVAADFQRDFLSLASAAVPRLMQELCRNDPRLIDKHTASLLLHELALLETNIAAWRSRQIALIAKGANDLFLTCLTEEYLRRRKIPESFIQKFWDEQPRPILGEGA